MDREDLGAQFSRITRRLIAAEKPLLSDCGLSMWQYIALSHLARRPVGTQLELARAIGYDKTRLISLLDGLQAAGLVEREPDPADRRARIVRLTAAGRARYGQARVAIHAMEDALLAELTAAERDTLRAALARLAEPPVSETESGPVADS